MHINGTVQYCVRCGIVLLYSYLVSAVQSLLPISRRSAHKFERLPLSCFTRHSCQFAVAKRKLRIIFNGNEASILANHFAKAILQYGPLA